MAVSNTLSLGAPEGNEAIDLAEDTRPRSLCSTSTEVPPSLAPPNWEGDALSSQLLQRCLSVRHMIGVLHSEALLNAVSDALLSLLLCPGSVSRQVYMTGLLALDPWHLPDELFHRLTDKLTSETTPSRAVERFLRDVLLPRCRLSSTPASRAHFRTVSLTVTRKPSSAIHNVMVPLLCSPPVLWESGSGVGDCGGEGGWGGPELVLRLVKQVMCHLFFYFRALLIFTTSYVRPELVIVTHCIGSPRPW